MVRFVRRLRCSPWLTAVVAALYCSANLWSFLHFVAVEHTTCPEHGEAIHASPASSAAIAPADRRGISDAEAVDVTTTAALAHEHDPCHLLSSLRKRQLVPASNSYLTTTDVDRIGPPPDHDRAAHSIDLRRLAPKQSPPA